MADIETDLKASLVPWPESTGQAHQGFAAATRALREDVESWLAAETVDPLRLVFTGHSLGAAMVTLMSTLVESQWLITLGSPRVGNAELLATVKARQQVRLVDCCDIVTQLPPPMGGYVHWVDQTYITRDGTVNPPPGFDVEHDRLVARAEYLETQAWKAGTVLPERQTAKHVASFEVVRRAVRRYHRTIMPFLPPASKVLSSWVHISRGASSALPLLALLLCSACASSGGRMEAEDDPTLIEEIAAAPQVQKLPMPVSEAKEEGEVEVPAAVAESEQREAPPKTQNLPELVVQARERHVVIRDLVAEGQAQLRDVELHYVFTGQGGREVLRGRPVAFALWSESHKSWTIAHLEIPRPPVKWKPGHGPLPFAVLTPGIEVRHVKGTGAERLMFEFSRGGEELKVYGRKFPVFDNMLIKKKRWREAVATARPIVYLPYTKDTLDPHFVTGGRDFLLTTARRAMDELRHANVPSAAFPGDLLADVVPAEVITTLAVIEQTDDEDFLEKGREAFDEVLSQYGLKREEAYRYSVSSAKALGPMQFTNLHGNGTYSLVVRRCGSAQLDPNFERGATQLLNAMKAAVCLLDIELAQMSSEIRSAYRTNPQVLGIFAVAAYNGGPRNVAKLYRALDRMGVQLGELRRAGQLAPGSAVACPCVWREEASVVRAVSIPRYNRENSGYIEKYQSILSLFD